MKTLFTTVLCAMAVWATDPDPGAVAQVEVEEPADDKTTVETEAEQLTETRHSIVVDGRELDYTATAGTITLSEEDGTEKANVFFVAYTVDDDTASRPVTFTFNGGPGSSSVWLHPGVHRPGHHRLQPGGP